MGVGRGVYAGGASVTPADTSGLAMVSVLWGREDVEPFFCDDTALEGPGGVRGGGDELSLELELDEDMGRGT